MIGALHEFHDPAYSQEWAQRFEATPERQRLFTDMADLLEASIPNEATVLELGIGPGYLAQYLLERFNSINYIGLDFSKPMLDIAGSRLSTFQKRLQLVQADLTADDLDELLPGRLDAVVSTWALHDLGSPENTKRVYAQVRKVLEGVFINGDFIKPAQIGMDFEAGRFEVSLHLQMLKELGFRHVSCRDSYETELTTPTAAQNFALIVGYS